MGILDPLGQVKIWKGCLHLRGAWGEGSDIWGDPEMPPVFMDICACHYTAAYHPGKLLKSPYCVDYFLVKINLDTETKTL